MGGEGVRSRSAVQPTHLRPPSRNAAIKQLERLIARGKLTERHVFFLGVEKEQRPISQNRDPAAMTTCRCSFGGDQAELTD
jgi:hypothetical protein